MTTASASPTLDTSLTPRPSAPSPSASTTRSWQTRPSLPLAVLCWPLTEDVVGKICQKGSMCSPSEHDEDDSYIHFTTMRSILPSIICHKYPSAPYWPDGSRVVEMGHGDTEFGLILAGNWGRQGLMPLPDPAVVETIADMLCLEGEERVPRWLLLGSTPRFRY
ncbi:hypothetical protein BD626DRAFT_576231 [Schizophyllum amplum]|uniref:Uncharacterized protein n=1 Tax=Schizophyllum amplum TaxID=97359 RepID=A0A550BTX2_9AGAR|nr:hypothetical protein BD626DRAFT_576231 [Auriculariopsis ampla]